MQATPNPDPNPSPNPSPSPSPSPHPAQVLSRMQAQTEEGAKTAEANRDWVQMQSLLISLRKCCNHPQLFGEWMGEVSTKLDEDLVSSSGKLAALDQLLSVLLPQGRRVVLFSGWTSMRTLTLTRTLALT